MLKRIHIFSLALLLAGFSWASWAAETTCIDAEEYQKLSKTYADLFARYDLPTIAQEFLDVSGATVDLKEQVNACQKSFEKSDQQRCDPLVKQSNAKRIERDALMSRFNAAIDMQEYMLTLKLKLERPQCGK
jgi:hypothetical protein